MVPMHAQKRMEAFHEPRGRAGMLPASVSNADGMESLALARSPGRLAACPAFLSLPLRASLGLSFVSAQRGPGLGADDVPFHLACQLISESIGIRRVPFTNRQKLVPIDLAVLDPPTNDFGPA